MERFPWYDSWWLERYVRAKNYIARHHPGRLGAFMDALEQLRTTPGFETRLIDSFFSPGQEETVRNAFRAIDPERFEMHEVTRHGRYVVHDDPALVDLQVAVAPLVGELVGEEVEPAYSFIAMYNRNGKCPLHLDAPVAKWTLDFCIGQSEPWPIAISRVVPWPENPESGDPGWEGRIKLSPDQRFSEHAMEPGQAIVFSGSSQWHYRDPFVRPHPRSHCDLLFMHFIPAGMKTISEWQAWEETFSLPGLTEAIR